MVKYVYRSRVLVTPSRFEVISISPRPWRGRCTGTPLPAVLDRPLAWNSELSAAVPRGPAFREIRLDHGVVGKDCFA